MRDLHINGGATMRKTVPVLNQREWRTADSTAGLATVKARAHSGETNLEVRV
jgi:hypothetical protein